MNSYRNIYLYGLLFILLIFFVYNQLVFQVKADEPFKLGVEEKGYYSQPQQGNIDYPAPQPVLPMQGNTSKFQTGISLQTLQTGIAKSVKLPPQFLGTWQVKGNRTKIEAQAQFQAGAQQAFAINTNNTWQIAGNPQSGYIMTNDQGVRTQLFVDKVEGNTAFIRYQHPVGNTIAAEAIVMSLEQNGARFKGLERISIVKEGQAPRARVTYQLIGIRQR